MERAAAGSRQYDYADAAPDCAATEQFRFKADHVFTITSRGTAIIGFSEQGTVRTGGKLQVIREDEPLVPKSPAAASSLSTGSADARTIRYPSVCWSAICPRRMSRTATCWPVAVAPPG
jgi:hypothetical protein